MIPIVSIFLFLFDFRSFFTLSFKSTSGKSFSVSSIFLEYWSIIQVSQSWNFANDSFPIVCDIFYDRIVLKVKYSKVWHFVKNFLHDSWIIDAVVLKVQGYNTGAIKESFQVFYTIASNTVSG